MQVPGIDQNVCGGWSPQDINMYSKLPYYLAKATTQFRKNWITWPKLLGKVPWTPNQGDTMKRVMVEPTPTLRQQAFPNLLSQMPKVDVIGVRERTTDAKLRWQQFVTPHFNFLPSFQDFMRGNIAPHRENIDRQILIFEEMFYRTHIFHWSPYVYLCGTGLVSAPSGEGDINGASGKSNGWLQNNLVNVSSHLSLSEVFRALNEFEESVGGTPYEGTGMPEGQAQALNERFCLVTQSEVWNQFIDDPWIKENRPLNMNIVTDAFKGLFWNKVVTKLERYGYRIKVDAQFNPTFPAPETIELNPADPEYGRTKPLPDYARNAQYVVSFLLGGPNYSFIEIGPPPADFAGGGVPEGFGKMNWNGKVILNKNFLTQCQDANGNIIPDTNSFGHYLRLQAEASFGIVGDNKFNILPIISLRRVGLTTN